MNPASTSSSHRRSALRRFLGIASVLAAISMLTPAVASASWWNHEWSYRKQVILDASPKGAAIPSDLTNVPVLVRLHDGVLKFSDMNPDGSDLRFVAEDDKTPLKFHVEKFDPVFNLAFVWVQVPKLASGAPTAIWMYYGNAKATSDSDARGTYDSNQTLVYHFSERGKPAADATGFANNSSTPFASDDSGLIGGSSRFDGTSVMALPVSPSLAITAGGSLAWSAWVKPAAPGENAVLYAQHDGAHALIVGLANGVPYVSVAGDSGTQQSSPGGVALNGTNWHHLAVVASGPGAAPSVTLYIDGQTGPALSITLPTLSTAATLGGDGGQAGAPVVSGFSGDIDEVELSKAARDAGFIALAAGNQGTSDKLVQFGGDEAQTTWSSGYVGIILGSVTLDGWVIIGVLMVMAVISWFIMAIKTGQINRASKGNREFLGLFRKAGGDFATLHRSTIGKTSLKDAPLQHLFTSGIEELQLRLSNGAGKKNGVLATQSIEAIRATIDSVLVTEAQSLNRSMVLLTIAISGGPFIGLLGTVVGVMITFAAVAAAGEVNVNAIAPGIAAALAATVAGLFVAIPALFGYNYLITRIKDTVAEMQVFTDAFITRMAENYNSPEALHQMAD